MKTTLIVANFKSQMDKSDYQLWIDKFSKHIDTINAYETKQIILAPSFPLLSNFHTVFSKTNIKIASQDVSAFDIGAYTGEVNAKLVREFADFSIIGHSERRSNFNESSESLSLKTNMALKYDLKPIFCVQDQNTAIPEGAEIIAYEPTFAIGSGNPDTPENANSISQDIKSKNNNYLILYGGSVSPLNVSEFTQKDNIDGVLVGGASLDPNTFFEIVKNA